MVDRQVTVESVQWPAWPPSTTDSDGNYRFAGLPAGQYRLAFHDPTLTSPMMQWVHKPSRLKRGNQMTKIHKLHTILSAIVVLLIANIIHPCTAQAQADEWINIHIEEVQLTTPGDNWSESEIKLYFVARFDVATEATVMLTSPYDGTYNVEKDAGGIYRIPGGQGGLSLTIPASVNTISLEVTAVDIDALEFNSPALEAVVDEALSDFLARYISEKTLGLVLERVTANKGHAVQILGRTIGTLGTAAYDYIAEEDKLGTADIVLRRENQWGPQRAIVTAPGIQVEYQVRTATQIGSAQTGVAASSTANNPATQFAYVNTDRLNVRNGPGTNYAAITTVQEGTRLMVTGQQSGWSAVQLNNGQQGWVASRFLTMDQSPSVPTATPTATRQQPMPTPTPTPTPLVAVKPTPTDGTQQLRDQLLSTIQASAVPNQYTSEARSFAVNLVTHLNEFQLPQEGITASTMQSVLMNSNSGDRVNAIVYRIWDDWRQYGLNHMAANPGQHGQSPFRQLVIRLVQGQQGTLSPQDQRALYSLFTRGDNTWSDQTARGVIGAINRDIYGQ